MSVGEFLTVLGTGVVTTALAIRGLVGAQRFAENTVRRRMRQALQLADAALPRGSVTLTGFPAAVGADGAV